jgi:beta-1,4-galactosyltransferase 1
MYENIFIVPYRDRKEHITYFINSFWPLVEKNVSSPYLLIVEQSEGKLFNRGKLINVGVHFTKEKGKYIITHDVDTFPIMESQFSYYNETKYDVCGICNAHNSSLGGICKIKMDKFFEINGFPNHIWGWGIEDRAFYYRSKIFNLEINFFCKRHQFKSLSHKSNSETYSGEKLEISNLENTVFNEYSKEKQLEHIFKSGINNLSYEIIQENNISKNIKHIIVNI